MRADEALIVVDVQNDFLETGSLPVPDGSAVVPVINRLLPFFSQVVYTQDWHPRGHRSFASTHGKSPFETIQEPWGPQVLWPDHCVQQTSGADFAPNLAIREDALVIRKGSRATVDSYSAFLEADRLTRTGLSELLKQKGVKKIWVCGLAEDFCVSQTALDGAAEGFEVKVIVDACRAIGEKSAIEKLHQGWQAAGIEVVKADSIK